MAFQFKRVFQSLFLGGSVLLLSHCSAKSPKAYSSQSVFTVQSVKSVQDLINELSFLEKVEGEKALEWVDQQNEKTLSVLESDSRFEPLKKTILDLLNAEDKILQGKIHHGYFYNFHQDADHVRGIWRRSPLAEYLAGAPVWDTLLDIDALVSQEGKSWVYKGANCLEPAYVKCLVSLSDGGTDAIEVREFDLSSLSFVQDGYFIEEAKSEVEWISENEVLVATDFGPDSISDSGYPREVRLWKRGTELKDAELLLEAKKTDLGASPYVFTWNGKRYAAVIQYLDFFHQDYFLRKDSGELIKIDLPQDASINALLEDELVVTLRSDWKGYPLGSLVSLNLKAFVDSQTLMLSEVFLPTATRVVESVSSSKNYLWIKALEDVSGKLYRMKLDHDAWTQEEEVNLPLNGSVEIGSSSSEEGDLLVSYEGFLTPTSLYHLTESSLNPTVIQKLPSRFDESLFEAKQFFATSKDGTKVPYFAVMPKGMKLDGSNPTLISAYGGFEVSLTPYYSSGIGKAWLEKGGVFILANIRGGGEYGPAWHQAALKEKRQNAYDDFFAVAEDLISRGITSPQKLGIRGGSNGGLLMGVALTQRPDLFKAIVCEVPLLDMIRYTEFPPGGSWVGEYGDPADPQMREAILKYSPLQNLKIGVSYPTPYFATSTKDDRVHPSHARKMAALMEEFGHSFYYFENREGGHSAGADLVQQARRIALYMTYLYRELEMN